MANCGGCGSRTICGCVLANGGEVFVFGDGNRVAPFSIYVEDFPRPRPQAWIVGPYSSNQGESVFASGFGGTVQESVPGMIQGDTTIVAPMIGTYLISFGSHYGYNANPTRGEYRIRLNNLSIVCGFEYTWGQNDPDGPGASKTFMIRLAQGDFINMLVQHQQNLLLDPGFIVMKWMGL